MKFFRIAILIVLAAFIGGSTFAQQMGELDRFENEKLETINKVRLFPNPTVDYLSVEIANSNLKDVKFTVHNIIGNVVEVEIEQVDENNFKVKVEDLPTGYYLLAIKDDKQKFRETYKFLKR
ncbi:T9SS type A sorting domain-containing protein [Fulvivirga sp. RKSG066]|uniref:T9SS type A sorting domain-containing protein n=1 Tax=Fulvivirga aurantia TaxID=2529383 RepID=UPI0012BCC33B|nr:T9SS type A sorting domain-containing protein [Fulvivirga aurantia]MTI23026.1 T9SS type A sorting domain-containing protein [Fulvivirga aurantia]